MGASSWNDKPVLEIDSHGVQPAVRGIRTIKDGCEFHREFAYADSGPLAQRWNPYRKGWLQVPPAIRLKRNYALLSFNTETHLLQAHAYATARRVVANFAEPRPHGVGADVAVNDIVGADRGDQRKIAVAQ